MKLLVFGGSGFVGSAVCRSAVARGWEVVSCTRRGEPFKTPSGASPAWVDKVEWRKGTAFDPATYDALLPSCGAVVSTLGILLEGGYKTDGAVNPLQVLKGVANNVLGDRGNPLAVARGPTYEQMNRDAAVAAFRAFAASKPSSIDKPSPFVFISAEDIFRPFVPARYIETKREAERIILSELAAAGPTPTRPIRPIFVRPSLIYHPHINPLSTIPATLISASSHLQSLLPTPLRLARLFADPRPHPSALASLANFATIPPIHVDTIGEAVCKGIEDDGVNGVLDVRGMRKMLHFDDLSSLLGMSKVVSQVLRLYTGRAFEPSTSPALSAVHARIRQLEWPAAAFEEVSKDVELEELLGKLDTKDGPEVVATVAFEDSEAVRKALAAPLFQLCTIHLKPEADREALTPSLIKTFTDCYEAPGFTGGDWGPDLNVPDARLNWYLLGWTTRKLHDEYQATDLFWLEVNKLEPHVAGGWAHFIELQKVEQPQGGMIA
ncbi:hypothetical protein RQP46_004933 [Phenoliferia psychrophenolica]